MSSKLAIDDLTKQRQFTASSPEHSSWVRANAGSGKTFVLARRVIRLLLSGVEPSKILCLTFTKAAAAEMSERVFDTLAGWTALSDEALGETLVDIMTVPATPKDITNARKLFAKAVETPGGLKIQTIHAFCERLLHLFPAEANVSGNFEVLDDNQKAQLVEAAERDVLINAFEEPHGTLAGIVKTILAHRSDFAYRNGLAAFLEQADKITPWIEAIGGAGNLHSTLTNFFGLKDGDTIATINATILNASYFSTDDLQHLKMQLDGASPSFQKHGALIGEFLQEADPASRLELYKTLFFTLSGSPRSPKSFASSAIFKEWPSLEDKLFREQERITELDNKKAALETIEATVALFNFGFAVHDTYLAKKTRQGLLDFDDLIEKTVELLKIPDAAQWVHYKLDRGIDHILIDEAQDTSPRQWEIISHLADEFFVGDSARRLNRTVFAVGDEKQSIYSFQGASPKWFEDMRQHFQNLADGANTPFETIPLSLSFRSTGDILGAVDLVFGRDGMKENLTSDYTDHQAARLSQPGFVELWPVFAQPEKPRHDDDWWKPLDEMPEGSAEAKLAEQLATKIASMIRGGTRLEGTGRTIKPGDILVLTRKRGPQVDLINQALKAKGLPVAGADRLKLTDSIAVLDLIALAEFVLLSEDDLALAGILKSPLIGMSEENLLTLSNGRKSTLWDALYVRAQKDEEPYFAAYKKLNYWRNSADISPPFDFFMQVLAEGKGRLEFSKRLGRETSEILDAFLQEVITFEQANIPTLQGFVEWFKAGSTTIKRDMEAAGEDIRVMTVHGSKGLEAPIVFLIDTGVPVHSSHVPEILGLGDKGSAPFIWKKGSKDATDEEKLAIEVLNQEAKAEYYRLLYVAMTRARDRLYVLSTGDKEGKQKKDGWFDVIYNALSQDQHFREVIDQGGKSFGWRWQSSNLPALSAVEEEVSSRQSTEQPSWLLTPASPCHPQVTALSPSRAGGEIDDAATLSIDTSSVASDPLVAIEPRLRGVLLHRLLERLPDVNSSVQLKSADLFLKANLPTARNDAVEALRSEVFGLLENPNLHWIFDASNAKSEVPILANLTLGGKSYSVRGEIDRLIVTEDEVHIVDYKTNRKVPETVEGIPAQYIRQLALYREVLKPLYPNKTIKTALIWTKNKTIMDLPGEMLDQSLARL